MAFVTALERAALPHKLQARDHCAAEAINHGAWCAQMRRRRASRSRYEEPRPPLDGHCGNKRRCDGTTGLEPPRLTPLPPESLILWWDCLPGNPRPPVTKIAHCRHEVTQGRHEVAQSGHEVAPARKIVTKLHEVAMAAAITRAVAVRVLAACKWL